VKQVLALGVTMADVTFFCELQLLIKSIIYISMITWTDWQSTPSSGVCLKLKCPCCHCSGAAATAGVSFPSEHMCTV
jgi:hypothetical protein